MMEFSTYLKGSAYLSGPGKKFIYNIKRYIDLEPIIWITAIVYLAVFNNPYVNHVTFCPVALLGFDFCPGCGLGNSISFLFKGDLAGSFNSHPLGVFALIIILSRIISLIKFNRRKYA